MVLSSYFNVDVYSHHFKLSAVQARGVQIAESFAAQYVMYGFQKVGRKMVRAPMKVFGVRVAGGVEYRFHIGQYADFISFLSNLGISKNDYALTKHTPANAVDIGIKIDENIVPRDYQELIHEYIISELPSTRKLVEIQTGKGKSYVASRAGAFFNKRIAIFIRPSFIEKWILDVKKYYGLKEDEIYVVQGSAALMNLLSLAKEGKLDAKVIIFSNKTMQNWFKFYELMGVGILDMGYDCLPGDYCEFLKIGYRIIDEVHLDFHLNFKIDLYTNVARSVSLSATMISDNTFLNKMYELAYPKNERFAGLAYDKYIDSYALIYSIRNADKIKVREWGSMSYSHNAFENSVIKNDKLLKDYTKMIGDCVDDLHVKRCKSDESALIYCSSVAMCSRVTDYLKSRFKQLDIRRYVGTENDPYDNLMDADICISTLLSAGTGHDIAGLISVFLTTSIMSTQSNIQGNGRLRKLTGKELRFVYFSCQDIPKQIAYHEKKKELLKYISKSYRCINYPLILG